MLREQPNLQIQLRTAVRLVAETVLTDEHEGRQKDGLQRHNHRQEPVGEGVKRRYPHMAGVHEEPGRQTRRYGCTKSILPEKEVIASAAVLHLAARVPFGDAAA